MEVFSQITKELYKQNREKILEYLIQLKDYEFIFDGNSDLSFNKENELRYKIKNNKIFLPITNQFHDINGIDSNIILDVYYSYKDVFELDESLNNKDAKLLVYIKDDMYQGCTWIMESEKYIGMYGIRSSVINYLKGKKGISQQILDYVKILANGRKIVLPWPLESMRALLFRNKFIEHNTM
jgi:hypothetical protein